MTLSRVLLLAAVTLTGSLRATDFTAVWSGANLSNSASATATIGLDLTSMPNPINLYSSLPTWLTGVTLTVSGAASGNGVFTRSDFSSIYFVSSRTLDFSRELVGQSGWSDFNLFRSNLNAPTGVSIFTLSVGGASGNRMVLTSFRPSGPTTITTTIAASDARVTGGNALQFQGGTFAPVGTGSLSLANGINILASSTGTLDAASQSITSTGAVVISGTSLTLTGSTSSIITLSGNISGAGILVNADGNNVISGTNTCGGISVTGGSLRLANLASLPSSNNSVTSGGTIILPTNIAFSGAVTIAGNGGTGQAGALVLDGTGSSAAGLSGIAVNLSGNATVALLGNQDYTLSGAIAGTAPGKSLTLDVADHSLKLTSSTASSISQLTKSGAGTLLVDTTGVINSASVVVANGLFTNNGTINGGISVSSAGTLGGSGTINGAVTVAGALSPGNSPGLQTQATGNTTLSSGSSFLAQLGGTTPGNGNGFHDQYYVQNGSFTIASNVRIDVRSWVKADGITTFVPARRDIFAVIRANNGIVGGFSDLTNADYSQWIIYENNSNPADQYGYLYGTGLTGSQTFAAYGNTAARAAIGASLWSAAITASASSTTAHPGAFLDGSTALGQAAIGLLTTPDTASYLDALSPEAYLAVGDYALTVSRSLTDAALSQATLIKTGSWTVGAGLNRAEHTYLGASDSLNYRLTSDSPLVAVAYEFSPRYSVGFFYGHNLGKTVADTARIDYRGSVFGLTSVGRFGTAYPVTLKGALVASDLRFEATRHGSTSGSQNLRSLGGQLTGSVELFKNDRLSFSPTLGYVLGRSTMDAFTESGTGANLSLDAMTQDSSRLVAGFGLTYLATTVLTFELSAAYEHEYASDAGSVSATFGGAGVPMTVVRAIEDRDSTTLGLGASLQMNNRSTFRLGAEVRGNREFRKDCRYNASVNVRF